MRKLSVPERIRCFNSRTREGCDGLLQANINGCSVSIHAPARGAIQRKRLAAVLVAVSIHAPARGAIYRYNLSCARNGFNSRTREGCDNTRAEYSIIIHVSIHAPARGAMVMISASASVRSVSIHAPARGAITGELYQRGCVCFNSRTREGCDNVLTVCMTDSLFQFTHPRGVRYVWIHAEQPRRVSIHAPARGAIAVI